MLKRTERGTCLAKTGVKPKEGLIMDEPIKNEQRDVPADRAAASSVELEREAVARRAYSLYEERGCCDGCDVDDWLQAEAEVLEARAIGAESSAQTPPPAIAQAARSGRTSA